MVADIRELLTDFDLEESAWIGEMLADDWEGIPSRLGGWLSGFEAARPELTTVQRDRLDALSEIRMLLANRLSAERVRAARGLPALTLHRKAV